MMNNKFIFHSSGLYWWKGRYGRLYGGSYWKVTVKDEILVEWNVDNETKITLQTKKDAELQRLAVTINQAKRCFGSYGGGAFLINEFGQVIVPSTNGDGRRILVGEIEGNILLLNPEDGKWIDISDDSGFKTGDKWPKPYLGNVYRLSKNDRVYYLDENEDEREVIYPPKQDLSLIEKLRTVRPDGRARFIVNPYGIVLTKVPVLSWDSNINGDETSWLPVYVGRINYQKWFEKEE